VSLCEGADPLFSANYADNYLAWCVTLCGDL
jgi:hypothetical protein